MISEFVASIFSALVVSPIQADVAETLGNAGRSMEMVQRSGECLTTAGPDLIRQATDDPWWATTTIIGVSTGLQSPSDLLASTGADCAPLVKMLADEEGEN